MSALGQWPRAVPYPSALLSAYVRTNERTNEEVTQLPANMALSDARARFDNGGSWTR